MYYLKRGRPSKQEKEEEEKWRKRKVEKEQAASKPQESVDTPRNQRARVRADRFMPRSPTPDRTNIPADVTTLPEITDVRGIGCTTIGITIVDATIIKTSKECELCCTINDRSKAAVKCSAPATPSKRKPRKQQRPRKIVQASEEAILAFLGIDISL